MPEINWAEVNAKLPHGRSDEEKAKRKALFDSFDNGNGMLSLAEIDKGIRDVLHLDAVFDAKPAIMRAFQIAKSVVKSNKKSGDDFIEWKEFRFFLLSLRQYFEYYEAFTRIDDNSDHRITLEEFVAAKSKIEQWVGPIKPEAEFKVIDKNHGGFILFDEFCDWAIKKNLDLEDDID
ncbi:flagellar calcium-binding protein TB-44A [Hydra vulgaris]|uniref:Flagellar calcium-binding protein TB-44A n=1 Tax=Hydra vulgaris TaxID=6087 RepID=A0ABM4DJ57_HYDVU